ncbi:MAG: hypothetical protein JO359_15015 [Candidatus Eremiobacteraeota bacterium]|nr:hypothetical protein [Candidatus Eremiobacteraeota bacterium]
MSTRRGPELHGVYRNELDRALHEDAFECAFRAALYKFGRLSNRRILELLRATAASNAIAVRETDRELLDRWFATYSFYFRLLKDRRPWLVERPAS